MKKIVIASGGTGGHIYPGIVIGKRLKELNIDILFIIDNREPGISILKKEGLRFKIIPIFYWKRKVFSLNTAITFFLNLIALGVSFFILFREKPSVVLGMGGYPSFPVVLASFLLRIPRFLHEQNARLGLANRLLFPIAKKVATSFEQTIYQPKNTVFTGCPIRKEIGEVKREDGLLYFGFLEDKKTILIFGGSQGSSMINDSILEIIQYLLEFRLIWITGNKDYQKIKEEVKEREVFITPFIFEMEKAYAIADIVISRSGATTVAEIKRCGIPAILIPYPSPDNHQLLNARGLQGVIIIKEENLNRNTLLDAIDRIKDRQREPCRSDALEKLIELILT